LRLINVVIIIIIIIIIIITGCSFTAGHAAVRAVVGEPPSIAEVKNEWSHTSTLSYAFMA
jgi:hypothetical protein